MIDHPFLPRMPKSAEPNDKMAALMGIADAVERGEVLPAESREWFVRCLRRVFTDPGVSFEDAFGIRVKNGGRSIATTWDKRQRNELLQTAAPFFSSKSTVASTGLYRALKGELDIPLGAEEPCQALLKNFSDQLVSPAQIFNVVGKVFKTGI